MERPSLSASGYRSIAVLICLSALFGMGPSAQSTQEQSTKTLPGPANPGFEEGEIGKLPMGWISPTQRFGYLAQLTDQNPKSGKYAALLSGAPNAQARENAFGNLMQVMDAAPYHGRRVRFRAAVRAEASGFGDRAALWLRVDRSDQKIGFFDNMENRPITSPEWQYYEIVGDIDEEAAAINIGIMLFGGGKTWIDDVSITDLGKAVAPEPFRPLVGRALENLVAFTRLLGYVRHFHPSDGAAATDWDKFAIDGVRAVEECTDPANLAQRMEMLFRPIAPTVRVFTTGKRPPLPPELTPPANEDALKIVAWRHKGLGFKSGTPTPYKSERVRLDFLNGKIPDNMPDPLKPFVADLGGGVSCLVPMALIANAKGTLPQVTPQPPGTESAAPTTYTGRDRATRLADVALAWNVFQHFYPYFDVVKTDWSGALVRALTSAATDVDEAAFLTTLRRLVVSLHDGHGGVYHPSEVVSHTIPVLWEWIEGNLVITHVAPEGTGGLQPGDTVLEVNGRPSSEALSEQESVISGATPQWIRYKALQQLRMGALNSEVRLVVQHASGNRTPIVLRRSLALPDLTELRPPKVHEINAGIFYLDLNRIKDEDFLAVLPKLEKAKGIIFDLRGYPRLSARPIQHLIDKPVQSARWNVPIVTAPDYKNVAEYDTGGRWTLTPMAPRLAAKLVFLTDGRAISYAESYLGIIEAYKLAEIVGEPTAGTNGNINPFTLPGGYRVVWTGMKVLKHDGSQHHGIGIQPTVRVSRTIRGITEKRDEQLERAIALVNN